MIGVSFGVAAWAALTVAGAGPPRPWENVTPEQEQAAKVLFERGNRELLEYRFTEAARDFREALTRWDLPAIHYNLAVALQGLSDFLGAREHLLAAIKYGKDGMADVREYRKAMEDLAKVEGELSKLVISCDQEGAKVSVDERRDLLTCPKKYEEWTRPGIHVVAIRLDKPGYSQPVEQKRNLARGERAVLQLRALPDEESMHSPLPGWLPLTAIGVGAAAAAGGGVFHLQARNDFRTYDDGIFQCAQARTTQNPSLSGCVPEDSLTKTRTDGVRKQNLAIGMYVGGGLAVAAGIAGLVINVPKPRSVNPETGLPATAIAPMLGPGGAGVALTFGF